MDNDRSEPRIGVITDTLATPELSEWLTQHDADPMHMSPAEFGAFVVSEAERAAVLLSTS